MGEIRLPARAEPLTSHAGPRYGQVMTCSSCAGELTEVEIKGYRMLVKGESAGRPIVTKSCTSCGLIHFFDPRHMR